MEQEQKKQSVKDIIVHLHQGLSVEAARDRFVNEVGSVTSTEIAEIEQSLINDGLAPDEIKKFCNVHALLFENTLKEAVMAETSPSHPVALFKLENRAIEQLTSSLKKLANDQTRYGSPQLEAEVNALLLQLKGLEIHYARKENLLFPFLEKAGFFGPSKVMWGKDNDIRDLLRAALTTLETTGMTVAYVNECLKPLIEEVDGMIFKEEQIFFPTCLEKLTTDDWVAILKDSPSVGYVFIKPPQDTDLLIRELQTAVVEAPRLKDENLIGFPTGNLYLDELMGILNALPVDITFIDRDDRVRYFSAGQERIFVRTKAVIGRQVQNCHPPQSVANVERILNAFKKRERDTASFWIRLQGKLIYIRYFAVRDGNGEYLGTLEVTQDITAIKQLEGEKRLLDEML